MVAASADVETVEAMNSPSATASAALCSSATKRCFAPLWRNTASRNARSSSTLTRGGGGAQAVAIVREGSEYTLMKGLVNTEDFLHAVLDKENGLRTGRILSHLAVLEIPGEHHLSFCADSGFIIAPTLKEKKYIIANSLRAIHALGYEHVNVAILAANERVNPDMPATVDAAALVEAWRAGEFDGLPCTCTIEGPMAIDVVASKEAAERKASAAS